jgi:multidrug/hemolysin transport system permease protein
VTFRFGDYTMTPLVSVGILVFTAVLFYGLTILNLSQKRG